MIKREKKRIEKINKIKLKLKVKKGQKVSLIFKIKKI